MAVTTYTSVTGAGAGQIGEVIGTEWLVREFLDSLEPEVSLLKFGTYPDMPLSTSLKARWLIFSRITPDASPSSTAEGVAPTTARDTDVTAFDATVAEYRDYLKISSLLDVSAISGTTQKLARIMGQLAAEQIENLIADELDAATLAADADLSESDLADNSIFDTNELFKAESLKRISKKMSKSFVKRHMKSRTGRKYVLAAGPRIFYEWLGDTQAQANAVTGGSGVQADIAQAVVDATRRISAGGVPPTDLVSMPAPMGGEFHPGMFGVEVHYYQTDRVVSRTVNGGAEDTENNFVFGNQAFGVVDLNSPLAQPAIIRKIPGPQTVSVPTDEYQTIGYSIRGAVTRLDPLALMVFGAMP